VNISSAGGEGGWYKIYNNKEVYSEKKQLIFRKIVNLYCIPNQNKTSPFRKPGCGGMELQLRLKNRAQKKGNPFELPLINLT